MILDFIILRNGLPVFTINFDPNKGLSHDKKKFTLISGFLSAVNSFVDSVENLGQVDEIQMSTDVFFSFQRIAIEDGELLFILVANDQTPKEERKLIIEDSSEQFLGKFQTELEGTWDGNMDTFSNFNDEIYQIMDKFNIPKEKPEGRTVIIRNSIKEFLDKVTDESEDPESIDTLEKPVVPQPNSQRTTLSDNISAPVNPLSQRFQKYQLIREAQSQMRNSTNPLHGAFKRPQQQYYWDNEGGNSGVHAEMRYSRKGFGRTVQSMYNGHQNNYYDQISNNIHKANRDYRQIKNPESYTNDPYTDQMVQAWMHLVPWKRPITAGVFRRDLRTELMKMLFVAIDGKKSISDIASQVDVSTHEIVDTCEQLNQMGLIHFR